MKAGKILLFAVYGVVITGFCVYHYQNYTGSMEEIHPYQHYYETEETTETSQETKSSKETKKTSVTSHTGHTETRTSEIAQTETEPETIMITELETEIITTEPETIPVSYPLELNQASFEELCTIPEIGEVTAQAILDYRNAVGGFQNREQLLQISGIGQKTYEIILPYLYLEHEMPLETEPETEPVPETVPEPTEPPPETSAPEIPVINLNTATKEQLLLLPGCDEILAEKILSLRDNDIHVFHHILELNLLEEITPQLFTSWEKYLAVNEQGETMIPYIRPNAPTETEENQHIAP